MANKPQSTDKLLTIKDYANMTVGRRGFTVTTQYVYKIINEHKKTGKKLPFEYVEVGEKKAIWIKRSSVKKEK
jgi:hypothetical protein